MITTRRCLVRLLTKIGLATTLLLSLAGGATEAQERVNVTVQQLVEQKHRLEVKAGSEIVWNDPHFDNVWFPSTIRKCDVRTGASGQPFQGRERTVAPSPSW